MTSYESVTPSHRYIFIAIVTLWQYFGVTVWLFLVSQLGIIQLAWCEIYQVTSYKYILYVYYAETVIKIKDKLLRCDITLSLRCDIRLSKWVFLKVYMMLNVPGLSNKSTKLFSLSMTQIEDQNKQNYFFVTVWHTWNFKKFLQETKISGSLTHMVFVNGMGYRLIVEKHFWSN